MDNKKPGDIIIVKVGGKEYETIIDDNGTQRFRQNTALRALLDAATSKGVDLNLLASMYHGGEVITQRDYAEFNMMLGYSVSGFSELSFFYDMEIENPLWEERDATKETK
jgi:hypothetical protein